MRALGQWAETEADNWNMAKAKFRTKFLGPIGKLLIAFGAGALLAVTLIVERDASMSKGLAWGVGAFCFGFVMAEISDRFLHYIKFEDASLFVQQRHVMWRIPYSDITSVEEHGEAVHIKYWHKRLWQSRAKESELQIEPERRALFLEMLRQRLAVAA
jgi:hypothetical protein